MFPDDSLQSLVGNWWIEDHSRDLRRGRLLWAFVPHVGQEPTHLVAEGRTEPTQHGKANYIVEPLRVGQPRRAPQLPVAALPEHPGEVRMVVRAKVRPVLLIGAGGPEVSNPLRTGEARWQTAPTITVAPYYGASQDGTRGGWRPEFVERIRHCEYPQYIWDNLPLSNKIESILRLDHIQPVGRHANAYDWTKHCLSDEALSVLDEYLAWLTTGKLSEEGVLAFIRSELMKTAPQGEAPK